MFALVAIGENNLKVVCRLSNSKDNLEKFLKETFPDIEQNDKYYTIDFSKRYDYDWKKVFTSYCTRGDGVLDFCIKEVELDSIIINYSEG